MTHQDILTLDPKYALLGFGLMRLPSAGETKQMVDMYIDAGFNYFDTAYVYGDSEDKMKKTLCSRHQRDSFIVANKMPPWMVNSPKDCDKIFAKSLKNCGLDHFDFYLVHSIDDGAEQNAIKAGIFEWIVQQKKKGLCKHIGFSFHGTTGLLDRLLTNYPEMEFVQLQLNYIDILRGKAGELHEVALKHKKPVIVMEPVKGGMLAKLPKTAEAIFKNHAPDSSAASWAVRYAASLSGATCLLSGMSTIDQMKDNIKTYKPFTPITPEELDVIDNVLQELSKIAVIPCTSCGYCLDECPKKIAIPACFNLYNDLKRGAAKWNLQSLHRGFPEGQRAGDCISCGACVPRCPQHINIPEELKTVAGQL